MAEYDFIRLSEDDARKLGELLGLEVRGDGGIAVTRQGKAITVTLTPLIHRLLGGASGGGRFRAKISAVGSTTFSARALDASGNPTGDVLTVRCYTQDYNGYRTDANLAASGAKFTPHIAVNQIVWVYYCGAAQGASFPAGYWCDVVQSC